MSVDRCEPCTYRGITSSALKYCKTCQEHLCKDCVDFHKSFKITRDHLLVNTEDQQSLKLCLDMDNLRLCKHHLNKKTEFYCATHDTLLCSLCLLKSEEHRTCKNQIVEIESVGKSLIDSKFADKTQEEYRNIIECARGIVNDIKEAKDITRKSVEAIKCEADALRRKFLKAFDRQIQKIVKASAKVKEDINDKYANTIDNMETLIKAAEDDGKISKTIVETGTPEDVFRWLITVLQRMEELKTETEELSKGEYKDEIVIMVKSDVMKELEKNEKPFIDFHLKSKKLCLFSTFPKEQTKDSFRTQIAALLPDTFENKQHVNILTVKAEEKSETVNRNIESLTEHNSKKGTETKYADIAHLSDLLGNSSDDLDLEKDQAVKQMSNDIKQTNCQRNLAANYEIELKHCFSFAVSPRLSNPPWFGGIICLPNERIILSDIKNSRLILLDEEYQVLLTKSIKYEPGAMCLMRSNCVAVCLMKTNQILLFDTSKHALRETKYVQTKYRPKCVQPVNGKMLVSSQDGKGEWHLELITVEGIVCQKIAYKLHDGYKIAIQVLPSETDEFRIVHCCEITNNLQCFGSDGSFVFDYGVDRGSCVVTDSNGYIFVIRYSGEVQALSPNGQYLLRLHSNTMFKANFAAFNQTMDKLFITTYKEPTIHVLNVKRTAKLDEDCSENQA